VKGKGRRERTKKPNQNQNTNYLALFIFLFLTTHECNFILIVQLVVQTKFSKILSDFRRNTRSNTAARMKEKQNLLALLVVLLASMSMAQESCMFPRVSFSF
jgi:hypothetical protein